MKDDFNRLDTAKPADGQVCTIIDEWTGKEETAQWRSDSQRFFDYPKHTSTVWPNMRVKFWKPYQAA